MKSETLRLRHKFWLRSGLFMIGLISLIAIYIFQGINLAGVFGDFHPNVNFIVNRTSRLILNDVACFLIIFALFWEAKYLKIAFWVFLAELLIMLPVYFVVKLTLEGDSEISSPLLSQVHRLVVNPMLMILLIMGFLYQRFSRK